MVLSAAEILVLFLALMGPTKALIVYAGMTASTGKAERRGVAIRAIVVASCVTFLFLWAGDEIIAALHIQVPALKIAGGIILLLFALDLVLGGEQKGDAEAARDIAVFPLAMPLMASPQGIVILITFSASFVARGISAAILYILLGVTMLVNLLVLLTAVRLLKYVPASFLMVLMKIAGVLLAALAIQIILWGFRDLGWIPAVAKAVT